MQFRLLRHEPERVASRRRAAAFVAASGMLLLGTLVASAAPEAEPREDGQAVLVVEDVATLAPTWQNRVRQADPLHVAAGRAAPPDRPTPMSTLVSRLDLTPEQRQEIRQITQQQRDQIRQRREQIDQLREQVRDAAEAGDEAAQRQAYQRLAALLEDAPAETDNDSWLAEQVRPILTAEQREQLDQAIERRDRGGPGIGRDPRREDESIDEARQRLLEQRERIEQRRRELEHQRERQSINGVSAPSADTD